MTEDETLIAEGDAAVEGGGVHIFDGKVSVVEAQTRELFLVCPACSYARGFQWGHLPPGTHWGYWYCDKCGACIDGNVAEDGGPLDVKVYPDKRKIDLYVLLEVGNSTPPVYVVAHGMRFLDYDSVERDAFEYFYNEHTCPTNVLFGAEMIVRDGDGDPHGVLSFVAAVDQEGADLEKWQEVFPEAVGGPRTERGRLGWLTPEQQERRRLFS